MRAGRQGWLECPLPQRNYFNLQMGNFKKCPSKHLLSTKSPLELLASIPTMGPQDLSTPSLGTSDIIAQLPLAPLPLGHCAQHPFPELSLRQAPCSTLECIS